jgi:hypothetical protein
VNSVAAAEPRMARAVAAAANFIAKEGVVL